MASMAIVISTGRSSQARYERSSALARWRASKIPKSLFALGLDDFFAAIDAAWADVVTQMWFAGGWLNGQCRVGQEIMRTMHPAFGRGFFILLNCHLSTPQKTSVTSLIGPAPRTGFPSAVNHLLPEHTSPRDAWERKATPTTTRLQSMPPHPILEWLRWHPSHHLRLLQTHPACQPKATATGKAYPPDNPIHSDNVGTLGYTSPEGIFPKSPRYLRDGHVLHRPMIPRISPVCRSAWIARITLSRREFPCHFGQSPRCL